MSQTTASRPALRVALADDAALFRQGLALLLAEAGFTVSLGSATRRRCWPPSEREREVLS